MLSIIAIPVLVLADRSPHLSELSRSDFVLWPFATDIALQLNVRC